MSRSCPNSEAPVLHQIHLLLVAAGCRGLARTQKPQFCIRSTSCWSLPDVAVLPELRSPSSASDPPPVGRCRMSQYLPNSEAPVLHQIHLLLVAAGCRGLARTQKPQFCIRSTSCWSLPDVAVLPELRSPSSASDPPPVGRCRMSRSCPNSEAPVLHQIHLLLVAAGCRGLARTQKPQFCIRSTSCWSLPDVAVLPKLRSPSSASDPPPVGRCRMSRSCPTSEAPVLHQIHLTSARRMTKSGRQSSARFGLEEKEDGETLQVGAGCAEGKQTRGTPAKRGASPRTLVARRQNRAGRMPPRNKPA